MSNDDYCESTDSESMTTDDVEAVNDVIKMETAADGNFLNEYQNVDIFTQQLPYFDKVKACALKTYDNIKHNLVESVVLNEIRPGFTHWTNQLITFLHEYGLFFNKQEHVRLVKFFVQVITTPDLDLPTIDFCLSALFELLKKRDKLSREDLVIEWRPIYKLYLRINKINDLSSELAPENMESNGFANFIKYARIYFPITATKEMLEEWRPLMCVFDSSMSTALNRFKIFLPTVMNENEYEHGYKLWLNEFLNLWTTLENRQHWEAHLISIMSRLATDNIGEIDWNPYIPFIFSHLLRGFGLPFGSKDSIALAMSTSVNSFNNSLSQIFVNTNEEVLEMCTWIVSMISCGSNRNLCMDHIKKLFQALRSFYYPSNTGSWSSNLFSFLKNLPCIFIKRIKEEKREKPKWYQKRIKKENRISDADITEFVNAMKDVVFTAIFSKSNQTDAKKAFQYLSFLRGEIMLPNLIDKIYESLDSVTEPHRYTSMLSCLVSVGREIPRFNQFHKVQTQMHVIQLLIAVLPGLDPNDSNKCFLTLQFIYNIISCIVVCNCQPALNYRNDFTEHERELCFETSKFEDFIHEFFKRIFYIVDILASDISAESSASAAAAHNQFSVTSKSKHLDENVYQAQLIQTLRIIVRQSSKDILKIITNKLKNYMNRNSYNARAGRILASLAGYLSAVRDYGATAFEIFFNHCYENLSNLKNSKTYEQFLQNERGDIEISWNLQLLSDLVKANGTILLPHMSRITQVLSWYRWAIDKEAINYVSHSYSNIIYALSSVFPSETTSVNYPIIFDDEREFFSKHLPIRDWAKTGDIFNLNLKYHIPNKQELEHAVEFTEASLNECMTFLTKKILNGESSSKEERGRELNYINSIVFAATKLLKRPNHKLIVDHAGSSVDIGMSDDIDKGCGFERCLIDDANHEYSKLSDKQKETLLTLREKVIRFMISLTDKVIEKFASETTLQMHITRILCNSSVTYGFMVNEFEKLWKNFYTAKGSLQNKLLGKKNTMRSELIARIMLQYQYRTFYLHTRLNELDLQIIDVLYRLSTESLYAVVRREAQSQLFSLVSHYPYSSQLIVPKIAHLLNKYNEETDETKKHAHDQLKGCLYLLLGNNLQDSFMIKQNWKIISSIWPAVFKCRYFEKSTIQDLLEKIYCKLDKDFDSFDNRIRFDSATVKMALELCPSIKAKYGDGSLVDDEKTLEKFHERCQVETNLIRDLMNEIVTIAKQSQTMWKNQATSFGAVMLLLHNCVRDKQLLSTECVQLFVDSLVNDNIHVRKVSMDMLCMLLKMTKPKKQIKRTRMCDILKEKVNTDQMVLNEPKPGYRADNQWHLYEPNYVDCETESVTEGEKLKWEKSFFLDKSYWGFYCWPNEMDMVQNKRSTYLNDEHVRNDAFMSAYAAALKPIVDRFMRDGEFVEKFIKISTIEESKGNEKFDVKKFYLFKSLFRNFGTADIVHNLFGHLSKLISDKETLTHECSHKLAAEMLSGLISGSKYWSLDKLKSLWCKLKPILDQIIENLSTDNIKLWYNCFSNTFEDQDPRRFTFYLNYFCNLTLKIFPAGKTSSSTAQNSFQQASCLQFLLAFNQFEWRIPVFWNRLLDTFLANMNHPYKTIREKNSSCLALAHVSELDFSSLGNPARTSFANTNGPNMQKLIDYIEARFNSDIKLFEYINEDIIDDDKESSKLATRSTQQQAAVDFLQAFFNWFGYYILKSYQPINIPLLKLIPQLCTVDKIAAQDATVKTQLSISRMAISMWILDPKCAHTFVNEIKKIIQFKSWHSRLAVLQMLQNYSAYNIYLADDELKSSIRQMIVDSLVDEQLEVRTAASLALTGFIHSNFIYPDQAFIDHLKALSRTKPKKKDAESGKMVIHLSNLVKRHGGILGLCAIVNSCPYDVPSYLPDVVTYICAFINDPVPIQGSVRKCLSEFRRTHHDNWQEHKQNFDENQLSMLADILISPSYYA